MKAHKLLVIFAFVSLMAFLNVSTFAQKAQAQPDPAKVMPRFVAQTLKAAGLTVIRYGNELTVEGEIVLVVPTTLQDWEDSGIKAKLVEQLSTGEDSGIKARLVEPLSTEDEGPSTEDLLKFNQFQQCLNTADFINQLRYLQCELNLTEVGDLVCKVRTLLGHVFDDLDCFFTYYCTPENNYCE